MKRLFCAALAAMMLMAPLAMTGCGDDSVRIDLCEVTHSGVLRAAVRRHEQRVF